MGGAPTIRQDDAAYLGAEWYGSSPGVIYRSSDDPSGLEAAPAVIAVAFRVITQPLTTTRTLLSHFATGGGWNIIVNGATNIPNVRYVDGGGTLRQRTLSAITTGDTNIHVVIGTHTSIGGGAGTIRARQNKGSWVTTALTGFTPAAAGEKLCVGGGYTTSVSGAARGIEILGFALGDTISSDGDYDDWLDEVASKAWLPALPDGSSVVRNFKGAMSDLCPRDVWTPDVGTGVDLERTNGTSIISIPRINRVASPTWAYGFTAGDPYTTTTDPEPTNGKVAIDAVGGTGGSWVDAQSWAFSGDKSSDFLSGGSNDMANLGPLGDGWEPEVIMLMLGVNGCTTAPDEVQEEADYASLLAYMYSLWPDAIVCVTTITPTTDGAVDAIRQTFNAALPAIWAASSYGTAGQLVTADAYSAIDPSTDTADGSHPNDAGYALLWNNVFRESLATAIAAKQGTVRVAIVGDSISVGVGSTSGGGWRELAADDYWPGPWQP